MIYVILKRWVNLSRGYFPFSLVMRVRILSVYMHDSQKSREELEFMRQSEEEDIIRHTYYKRLCG